MLFRSQATAATAIETYFSWGLGLALAAAVAGAVPLGRSVDRWRIAIDGTTISIVSMVLATLVFCWRGVLTFYAKVTGNPPPEWKGPDLGPRGLMSR